MRRGTAGGFIEFLIRGELIEHAINRLAAKILVEEVQHGGPVLGREGVAVMSVIDAQMIRGGKKVIGRPRADEGMVNGIG